jgi:hypothetical protein
MEQLTVKPYLLQGISHIHNAKWGIHIPVITKIDEKNRMIRIGFLLGQRIRANSYLIKRNQGVVHLINYLSKAVIDGS